MFNVQTHDLENGQGTGCRIADETSVLSWLDAIALWQSSGEFQQFMTRLFERSPYRALRWETPPVTADATDEPFEFVVLPDEYLAERRADPRAFSEHFSKDAGDGVVSFSNLGGDGIMVVPVATAPDQPYGHLAAFLREAPREQSNALWREVGVCVQKRLSDAPLWLSTAGGGVAWLHVRLDSRPKYYRYRPYRAARA